MTLAQSPKGGPVPCGGEGTLPLSQAFCGRLGPLLKKAARKCAGSEWGQAMKHPLVQQPPGLELQDAHSLTLKQGEEEEGARARKRGHADAQKRGSDQKKVPETKRTPATGPELAS